MNLLMGLAPRLRIALAAGACATLALAAVPGCSTTTPPERFHTLLAAETPTDATPSRPIYIDVAPVSVPAQVDHPQWIVRRPDGSLLVLEQDRWAAPLPDELREAIVARLGSRWSALDVRRVAAPATRVWRVRVDMQRFESVLGRAAREEATWSISGGDGTAPLVCRSTLEADVAAPGIDPLAAAHRALVLRLADAIGQALSASAAGSAPGCGAPPA